MSFRQRGRAARRMRRFLGGCTYGLVLQLQACATEIGPLRPALYPLRTTIEVTDVPHEHREAFLSLLECVNGSDRIDVAAWRELLPEAAIEWVQPPYPISLELPAPDDAPRRIPQRRTARSGTSEPSRAPVNNQNDDNHDPTKGPDLK